MAEQTPRSIADPKPETTSGRPLWIAVTLLFAALAGALMTLAATYWTRVLEPRLEREAVSQAEILAGSQAPHFAEALRADEAVRAARIVEKLDEMLVLQDPETATPFFQSVFLEVDYETVAAPVGSLDLHRGDDSVRSGFPVDVPINDPETYELLAVAHLEVNDRFFQQLSGDIRSQLTQVLGGSLLLLVIAWGVVLFLGRTLERQSLRRHRAERELWRHERKYERLVDSLSNYFVYRKDALGRVTSVSDSVERVLGFSPQAALAELTSQVQGLPQPNDPGRAHDREVELQDSRGTTHYVELSELPLLDEDGRVLGADGIARDVTANRLFEDELRHAKDQAETASFAKSQFLANMSHEVRTPLNAILGLSSLALKTELTPKQREYLEKANASGRLLLELVEDILDLSKIEAGRLEIQRVEFDLDDILAELADVVGMRAAETPLEIVFSASPDVPRRLSGDPTRLKQVLLNLIGNALKFTDEGEVIVEISKVEARRDRVKLSFSVHDTGIGIAADDLGALFEPFTQGDASPTRRYGGVGLGLAISRRLVELMGGELLARSREGKGSTFSFTASFRLAEGSEERRRQLPAQEPLRVLVADDNQTALEVLSRMLRSLSCIVTSVHSGTEALAAVRRADAAGEPFSIAVLDWKMPGLDGAETARQLVNLETRHPTPRVILVTAYGRDEVLRVADSGGIQVVLHKPVSPSTLHDAVVTVLEPSVRRRASTLPSGIAAFAPGQRVLLVEDNAINREVAREMLLASGLEVSEATNGREALSSLERSLASEPFDAVLMDVQMPEMDGLEAVRRLRDRRQLAPLPVIAMTAHAMLGDREAFLAAGMSDYVSKPVDESQLLATLSRWLRVAEEAPPQPPPGAPGSSASPSALASIDTLAGLRRVAGNQALYARILRDFAAEAEDARAQLRRLLGATAAAPESGPGALATDTSERQEILDVLHTLKGTAATVGAQEVADAATDLETFLRRSAPRSETDDTQRATRAFVSLEAALARATAAIALLVPAATSGGARLESTAHDIEGSLERMQRQLEDQDLAAAKSFATLKPLLPKGVVETVEALEVCLEELDYAAAREHFLALKSELQGVEKR